MKQVRQDILIIRKTAILKHMDFHRTTTPMKQMLIFLIVQRQNLLLVMMEDCQQQIRKYSQMQQYYTSLQNGRMAVPAEEQHLWLIKHKL